ncbi:E1-E2 ATPase-domain-containing protein [Phycomyces blakesleeanus]
MSQSNLSHVYVAVNGMTCDHCVQTITKALQNLPGVLPTSVLVDLKDQIASFLIKPENRSDVNLKAEISSTIEDLGYDAGTPRIDPSVNNSKSAVTASLTPANGLDQSNNGTDNHNTTTTVTTARTTIDAIVYISGMTCSHCTNAIHKALSELPSVLPDSIQVSLDTATAKLSFKIPSPPEITPDYLRDTIEDMGYDVEGIDWNDDNTSQQVNTTQEIERQSQQEQLPSYKTATFSVIGMTCSHCVQTVNKALAGLPGVIVDSIKVSLDQKNAVLSFQGDYIQPSLFTSTIVDLGYDVPSKPVITVSNGEKLFGRPASILSSKRSSSLFSSDADSGMRKVVMRVLGMTCESCVVSVKSALKKLKGVNPESVQVDLETEMAMFVSLNPDTPAIYEAIEERGFEADNIQIIHNLIQLDSPSSSSSSSQQQQTDSPSSPSSSSNKHQLTNRVNSSSEFESSVSLGDVLVQDSSMMTIPKKVTLQVSGMTCSSCVRTLEKGLAELPSVNAESVKVNLLTGTASFSVYGEALSDEMISKKVKNMGYKASNIAIIAEQQPLQNQQKKKKNSSGASKTSYKIDMIITGMFCSNCVEKVHKVLSDLPGTITASIVIDLDSGRTSFRSSEAISRPRIEQAALKLGLMTDSVEIIKQEGDQEGSENTDKENGLGSRTSKEEEDEEGNNNSGNLTVTKLTVTGMTCSSCVANIERTVMKQPGVTSCQVNLLSKTAVIRHDPSIVGARSLANMIEQIGYKAELSHSQSSDALSDQRKTMRETMDKEIKILLSRFLWSLLFAVPVVLISMIFMMAVPGTQRVHQVFVLPIVPGLSVGDLILFVLATPVQFWLGLPFYVKAYRSLRYAHTANMETLVAMGTTVAYVTSVASVASAIAMKQQGSMSRNYFETSVLLITFIHFGKWLEALAKGKTAETITKLMDLQPEKAILVEVKKPEKENDSDSSGLGSMSLKEGQKDVEHKEHAEEMLQEREIDSKDIQVGDILKVNAGARIPCDGKVWKGDSSADESMITGESVPVLKKESDSVITATINLTSPIYIRAIRVGNDTTLSRIIQMVQDAQASPKAPIEHLADNISSVFVPIVIVLALITYIIWQVLSSLNMYPDEWVPMGESKTIFSVMLGVSVLVIACPCGLGLASPTAVMVGTGVAARYGVLVKGGGYALEMANRITTVAFDKTGTLTLGNPSVTDSWINNATASKQTELVLWKILGRVASGSNHPLSKSIEQRARDIIASQPRQSIFSGDTLLEDDIELPNDSTSNDSSNENDNSVISDFQGIALTNAKEIPGRGLIATLTLSAEAARHLPAVIRHQRALNVFLGNQEWMDENQARYEHSRQTAVCQQQIADWQDKGQSIVMVAVCPIESSTPFVSKKEEEKEEDKNKVHGNKEGGCNNACVCVVCKCSAGSGCCSTSKTIIIAQTAIADIARPESKAVIAALQTKGIEVWMVTGDNVRTGQVIGEQLGIPKEFVLAGVKPEQKADKIRNLQRRGVHHDSKHKKSLWKKDQTRAVVAMIGDGINDSPALAQADVGISVGSATDIAIEAASIVLIRNNLMDLLIMYDVSRTVVRRIRLNFLWAFLYNVFAIPIAAGILYPGTGEGLPPYIAGLAMVASSVSVVCSSLLLRLYRPPKDSQSQKI